MRPLSLHTRLVLVMTALSLGFVAALVALQVETTRRGVREEVDAAQRVALQLLSRMGPIYARDGIDALERFLNSVGRVRANEVRLLDASGALRWASPPSPYRPGERAPEWFAALVAPALPTKEILLDGGGRLLISADASRAILDGWDDTRGLAGAGFAFLLLSQLVVGVLVGRATAPFGRIVEALSKLERGEHGVRLDLKPGQGASFESNRIAAAFNRMAGAVEDRLAAREAEAAARAAEASARDRLADSREINAWMQARIEAERRELSRELHDEFGQSTTAIRSFALAIARRAEAAGDADTARTATLIAETAAGTHASMQRLIARLRPAALDALGLHASLQDLAARTRARPDAPAIVLSLPEDGALETLPEGLQLAVYRIVQEGLTNALRHAKARTVRVAVSVDEGGAEPALRLSIEDDGRGPGGRGAPRADGFGLRGMRERVETLGGRLSLGVSAQGGMALAAVLPLAAPVPADGIERG